MNKTIRQKIARLEAGGRPRLVDLFAGCGGISLGFHRAGFELVGAVEFDPHAAQSHALNFSREAPKHIRDIHARARDITSTEPADFLREHGHQEPPERVVDVIVGGPPCQAFARVGRAKLREVLEHPRAFKLDPRSNLYLRYLHYVRELQPLALLMENVPDVLNYGGHNIAEEICETLADLGYECRYTLLNSVFYGVPEMRERMFLIAYHESLKAEPAFPNPLNYIELPRGYVSSRQVALQTLRNDLFDQDQFYTPPPEPEKDSLLPAVTAYDAISDLPSITEHLNGGLKRGARRFTQLVPYPKKKPLSDFARQMREWPGFEANGGVLDHVIRSLPRDYQIFSKMNAGDEYPAAHRHALDLFEAKLKAMRRNGKRIREGSAEYERVKRSIVPPYDPGKFPNKWRKMERNKPARTLMAHLGKDSYSHIHYDSSQARTISVREAARLQSFPDGFAFAGTMNPAFRQIGNAVPPLLAYRIAMTFKTGLGLH
ncbi:cytosine methyltransferase [Betaproteobacteria bacterium SCGC AG-212-J23]|nr:cytosine methyltransferase [Betaproteobacteria bacterium SCGC AG-212-J23]